MPAFAAKPTDPRLTAVSHGPERAQTIPRAFELGAFLSGSMYVYRNGRKTRKINRPPDSDSRSYRVLSRNSSFTTSLLANATPARGRNEVNAGVDKQRKQKISL